MSESNTPAHRTEEEKVRHAERLKKQALEQTEVKEVLRFIQKYLQPTAIVVAVVCAFILTNNFFRSSRAKKELQADTALMQASTIADYQAILDEYGKTPSAPRALMALAQQHFNEGRIDEAEHLYGQFIKKFAGHAMAVQAAFNQITCKEARGEKSDAAALYGQFWSENRESYLAPVALLGKGRCHQASEQYAAAKQAYEDVLVNYPDSEWARIAASNLSVVESKLP